MCLHCGLGFVERGLLASEDEELRIVHGRVRKNPMAQIQNVAVTIEFGSKIEGDLTNLILWAEKNGGVEIALEGYARAGETAEFAEGNTPIDAENLRASFHN